MSDDAHKSGDWLSTLITAGAVLAGLGMIIAWNSDLFCREVCQARMESAARVRGHQRVPVVEQLGDDDAGPVDAGYRRMERGGHRNGDMGRRQQPQVIHRTRQEFEEGQDYCDEYAHSLPFRFWVGSGPGRRAICSDDPGLPGPR